MLSDSNHFPSSGELYKCKDDVTSLIASGEDIANSGDWTKLPSLMTAAYSAFNDCKKIADDTHIAAECQMAMQIVENVGTDIFNDVGHAKWSNMSEDFHKISEAMTTAVSKCTSSQVSLTDLPPQADIQKCASDDLWNLINDTGDLIQTQNVADMSKIIADGTALITDCKALASEMSISATCSATFAQLDTTLNKLLNDVLSKDTDAAVTDLTPFNTALKATATQCLDAGFDTKFEALDQCVLVDGEKVLQDLKKYETDKNPFDLVGVAGDVNTLMTDCGKVQVTPSADCTASISAIVTDAENVINSSSKGADIKAIETALKQLETDMISGYGKCLHN